MMNEAEREAVAIQLGWISDLLADTERLIASNRGYARDLLESIDDDTCPFTFAEIQDEIRDLRESRAVDAALDGIKEMLDDVRAILTRASSHGASSRSCN
uniref:Rx N-terminal domain-containing protein n=1 Tax=Oryza meridionalis TaxID=40149 RepID=A0A0E0DXB4_9ORYZ